MLRDVVKLICYKINNNYSPQINFTSTFCLPFKIFPYTNAQSASAGGESHEN